MEEELKKLLRENLEISRESLKILRGIRRSHRIAATFKVFYWLVIIGSLIGAYYYLQPYIVNLINFFQQILNTFSELQKTSETLKSQGIPLDTLKNLPPDILKNLENILKTR